jgi:uncharacterized membrane protein
MLVMSAILYKGMHIKTNDLAVAIVLGSLINTVLLVSSILNKIKHIKTINLAVAGVLGSFVNTVLVMGSILILYKDAYAKAYEMDASAVLAAIGGVISINGVIEAIVSGIIVSAVGMALIKIKPIK